MSSGPHNNNGNNNFNGDFDDVSDIETPCSGERAHELWQLPAKATNEYRYRTHSTVPVTTNLPDITPSAPCKKKPDIAPKPVKEMSLTKGGASMSLFSAQSVKEICDKSIIQRCRRFID